MRCQVRERCCLCQEALTRCRQPDRLGGSETASKPSPAASQGKEEAGRKKSACAACQLSSSLSIPSPKHKFLSINTARNWLRCACCQVEHHFLNVSLGVKADPEALPGGLPDQNILLSQQPCIGSYPREVGLAFPAFR